MYAQEECSFGLNNKSNISSFAEIKFLIPVVSFSQRLNLDSYFKILTGIDFRSDVKLPNISNYIVFTKSKFTFLFRWDRFSFF